MPAKVLTLQCVVECMDTISIISIFAGQINLHVL